MKNLIKIMICFSLIYTPFFSMSANASNVGGWNLSSPIAQGASTFYDATKQVLINGKQFIKKSSVTIVPTASQVAKVLARGGAGYALSVAVEELLGAVDWVLDPANNQIKYYEENKINVPRLWRHTVSSNTKYFVSPLDACNEYAKTKTIKYSGMKAIANHPAVSGVTNGCYASAKASYQQEYGEHEFQFGLASIANPSYDPNAEREEKTLPLTTVASQVINNAESEDEAKAVPAQTATTAVASDTVAEAEKDDTKARPIVTQAESNSQTSPMDETGTRPQTQAESNTAQGTQTQNSANPAQTDLALEFPVFCNWAPTICEAAQVVISFPQTLTGWWDTANHKSDEWVTSISEAYYDFINDDELPNEETKVDITDIPTPDLQENAISWAASCPADVSLPISMQGVSSTIVFSWSPWCQLLSIIKPAIVASAYIGAAFIVLGLRT